MKLSSVIVSLVGVALAYSALSQSPTTTATQPDPVLLPDKASDYSLPANWLCRPGKSDDACSINLDAIVIGADGSRSVERFVEAKDPAIDCFYVYPTSSTENFIFSDLVPGAGERESAAKQIARFTSVCRVFAPMYRQLTGPGLRWSTVHGFPHDDRNLRDTLAAWRYYMAHDNHGRGVVLIGHSQGARMIIGIIQHEIDGKPLQKQLVSALIAGNGDDEWGAGGDMTVATGSDHGGTFSSVPLCGRKGQIGCVVAWSTYPAGTVGKRNFGNNDVAGHVAACVNPTSLEGSRGLATSYLYQSSGQPLEVTGTEPFVKVINAISDSCESDHGGSYLALRVEPGSDAPKMEKYLSSHFRPVIAYHMLDIDLVQGNLIDLLRYQTSQYLGAR